jgi:hypothetical protein
MQRGAHFKRLITGSLLVLAAAFVVPRFVRAPDLDENRRLADAPPLPHGFSDLAAFRKGADAYVADHFPPRALLIGGLNYLRLKLGDSGAKRVIVGRDGWLFYDNDSHMGAVSGASALTPAQTRSWLSGLAGRTEEMRRRGIAYLVFAAPDKEAVYPEHGPAWFTPDSNRTALRLSRLAAQAQAGQVIYPADELQAAARAGLKVYEPNETHWTGLGAYEGYVALMRRLQAMGLTGGPRPLADFAYVRHEMWQTPRNLVLMLGVASFVPIDHPEIDDPASEKGLVTTYLTDQYDWTQPRVVDTGQAGKPVLLMTMDSFSNALLPLLYRDFSRIVLAHNQDGAWRQDLIDRFKPDIVVTEVVESGLRFVMSPSPDASAAALTRIDAAMAHPAEGPAPAVAFVRQAGPRGPGPRTRRELEPVRGHVENVIYGGPRDEAMDGTEGPDVIYGRGGNDVLRGLGGDDVLRGGKGDDRIEGGDGGDWLSGDRGDDTLTGGRGADVFHSSAQAGLDLVVDFNAAEGDRIELDRGTAYTIRQAGADAVIEMAGTRLVLKGVSAAALPKGAIRFK